MSSRAKIAALVLVNWKGVFYERYLLDRHVTALEGANGAGKTTVMIAAYVALLPDMSKLRFTNLGETAATGGDRGIWGRLGELGRPSYTVLELDVDGTRLLAGVRLTRTTEPTVEPTAFLVDKLGPDVKLSDLLLVRRLDGDHVPELDEIKAAVTAAGGELHTFRSIKEYFAELFERGVTPMRLSGDEERTKLNEMLRTSMTGGISRALTSELRSFLLKEETGLGDTLSRMRANLEACARTRSEVSESRRLEREITAIYEAGADMFAATVHAARESAAQAERDVERARPVVDDAVRAERDHALAIEQLDARRATVDAQLATCRTELANATALRDRATAARAVEARLADLERELAALTDVDRRAQAEQVAATVARTAARADRTRALEALDRAAHGLADLQAGLDELVRRAHGYRQLARRLDDARRLTGTALTAEQAESTIAAVDAERAALETERARLDRTSRDIAARRDEHARALAALAVIDPAPESATSRDIAAPLAVIDPAPESATSRAIAARRDERARLAVIDPALESASSSHTRRAEPDDTRYGDNRDAYARARAALARLAAREHQLSRAADLDREHAEALRLAGRQAIARALAKELATADASARTVEDASATEPAPASTAVVEDLEAAEAELRELDTRAESRRTAVDPSVTEPALASTAVVEALEAAEAELRELDTRAESRRTAAVARRTRETTLRAQLATLDDRAARRQLAATLSARLPGAPSTRADVIALRERLAADAHALAVERTTLEQRRADLQQRATAVERSNTNLDPELLRLRDELGAELLASRFEDLDLPAASWVEAKLGPLADALIVDDLDAASAAVEASKRTAASVYLVRAGTSLDVEIPEDLRELGDVTDVVSVEPFGLRVTRRRPRPSLGRKARERQLEELHVHIARDADELDALATRTAQLAATRRDLEQLGTVVDALEAAPDDRDAIAAELAALTAALADDESAAATDLARAVTLRARLDKLRRLWPEAALLDPPEYAARVRELSLHIADRDATRADLRRFAAARATLADHLDALRTPPPTDDELAAATARRTAIDARLDELALALAALDDVLLHRHAAAYHDADAALDARASLAPALEAQHASARDAVAAAADAEATAESAWESATKAAQASEAARIAAVAHRDRTAAELAALAVPTTALPDDLDATRSHEPALTERFATLVDTLAKKVDTLDAESRDLVARRAVAAERLDRAHRTVDEARARLAALARDVHPTIEAWTTLRDRASTAGLLHAVLANRAPADRTSVQLLADAWSKREVLLDRLAHARGADELLATVRANTLDGLGNLATWVATRDWLRCRVPAQVADVDEPLLALERLRDHLDVLEGRLSRQETDLRGASEDVARGIDVQVRRAHGQVRRLNTQLEGIAFGSIQGIRVEIRRIDRMEQILRALRLGEAQELLFIASIPIEEALDEIFRRYGGGGRAGGQRLLDYREYVELAVEIRRQSTGAWEPASPTKLSTGEAIGVGAALMMVVLTEWERDANLLRAAKTGGSYRFLFLDEANRLSRDNLGVLFDLCKNLDLQLLIAAPEVARAEGNTTYRLVRHVTDDGREEVIVSGRRALPPSAETELADAPDALNDALNGAPSDALNDALLNEAPNEALNEALNDDDAIVVS